MSPDRYWLRNATFASGAPRPESWREDEATVAAIPPSEQAKRDQLFGDLAAAAESGWDFSTRWLCDGEGLASIRTSAVLPVELNSILYRNEVTLQRLKLAKNSLRLTLVVANHHYICSCSCHCDGRAGANTICASQNGKNNTEQNDPNRI